MAACCVMVTERASLGGHVVGGGLRDGGGAGFVGSFVCGLVGWARGLGLSSCGGGLAWGLGCLGGV